MFKPSDRSSNSPLLTCASSRGFSIPNTPASPTRPQVDAKRQKANLQKRLAARRQVTDAVVAAAQPVSQQAAAKAAALAGFAEEAERNALDKSLLEEAIRIQSEAEGYERSIKKILTSADEAAKAAAAASAEGSSPAAVVPAAEETKESLRAVHERAIAAMEVQNENKRRAAAAKLAQRRAAARASKGEAMRAAGKSEEHIAKLLQEVRSPAAKTATGIEKWTKVLGLFCLHFFVVFRGELEVGCAHVRIN